MLRKFTFQWVAFLISFCIGLLAVYLIQPAVTYIYTYPNPNNMNRIIYKDFAGDCYKFKIEPVECTKDAIEQPLAA